MKNITKILSAAALLSALTLSGCYSVRTGTDDEGQEEIIEIVGDSDFTDDRQDEIVEEPDTGGADNVDQETSADSSVGDNAGSDQATDNTTTDNTTTNNSTNNNTNTNDTTNNTTNNSTDNSATVQPTAKYITYIKVTGDGVNLRTGASTSYKSLGVAEKDTLYAVTGTSGGWYKTYYKNSVVYISSKYCAVVEIQASASEEIERVIAEGTKCLGVTYVYGATRYHDGNGNKLSGFTNTKFDCSSLMQYIFKKGADVNLQVTTRTQIYQGTTVKRSQLKRGDLIFFTNSSRQNNTGIERVGHVALYLGDNYILHTASDYAKIEQISSARSAYYIQSQRMIK